MCPKPTVWLRHGASRRQRCSPGQRNPWGGLGGTFGISSEHILFATCGKVAARSRITGTVFHWKRPYDKRGKPQHSAKPEGLQDMAEQVSHGAYLELFARRKRPGWSSWGNAIENDLELFTGEPRT